jgi:glucose/arabinose dehydrogenase
MGRTLVASIACGTVTLAACSGGNEPARVEGDDLRLVEVATLDQPLALAAREGDDALYVAQKTGRVMAVRDGAVDEDPVLDVSDEVSQGGEQGLLGLTFSPDGARLYTNHTDADGHTRITEWMVNGDSVDPGSRRELLVVEQPFSNHNGGDLAFGPDGYLYIGLGDGGSGGDPMGNGQSLQTLLGKMLRIDPRPDGGVPYSIPGDNPFVDRSGALPEIWAYGLRNPWRFSFDRDTGDLWIADVGQSDREEVNRQEADSGGGENYGWNRLEGTLEFEGEAPPGAVPPVFEYGRDEGSTVIGGYVYRGSDIPALAGSYLFGDLTNPELRALELAGGVARVRDLGVQVENLVAFGQDASGELYVVSLSGPVFRLAPPASS